MKKFDETTPIGPTGHLQRPAPIEIYVNGIKFLVPHEPTKGSKICDLVKAPKDNSIIERDEKVIGLDEEIILYYRDHFTVIRKSVIGA